MQVSAIARRWQLLLTEEMGNERSCSCTESCTNVQTLETGNGLPMGRSAGQYYCERERVALTGGLDGEDVVLEV